METAQTAHVIAFRPRRPTTARCLDFASYRNDAGVREPVSPFRHLMGSRQLTPRQVVHRRLMLEQLARRAPSINVVGRG